MKLDHILMLLWIEYVYMEIEWVGQNENLGSKQFCLFAFLFCFVSWPLLLFFFFSFFDIIDIVKVPFLGQKCRLSFKLWKVHNRYYPKQNYYSKIISVYKIPQIPRCILGRMAINTDYPSAVVFEKFAAFYCEFISPLLSCCHQLQSEDLTQ